MPSINLRLSDEEHDALRKWAFDSRRSLQKEIVFRLFSSGAAVGQLAVSGSAAEYSEGEGGLSRPNLSRPERAAPDSSPVVANAQPRDIPARTVEPHFKPDPK